MTRHKMPIRSDSVSLAKEKQKLKQASILQIANILLLFPNVVPYTFIQWWVVTSNIYSGVVLMQNTFTIEYI